jgi:uncharacterized repeat protein (TIGR03803 family)
MRYFPSQLEVIRGMSAEQSKRGERMAAFARMLVRIFLGAALLAPVAAQAQTLQTMYTFAGGPKKNFWNAPHGALPVSGLLKFGPNLYGTTEYGGTVNSNCAQGCGTIFKLSPTSGKLATIYKFCSLPNCTDGGVPRGGLVADSSGALYGTTVLNGEDAGDDPCCGTVFKLTPPAAGQTVWTLTTLYTFGSNPAGFDGAAPQAGLVFDTSGNLYGTTAFGGTGNCGSVGIYGGCGTLFKLVPSTGMLTTLYSFTANSDGSAPVGGLVFGKGGALYGTTEYGGDTSGPGTYAAGNGTVFAFNLTTNTLTTLIAFPTIGCSDGINNCWPGGRYPLAGLITDKTGALYGTTSSGGGGVNDSTGCGGYGHAGCGTVFKLSPGTAKKPWSETVLYWFCPYSNGCTDTEGANPSAGLVFDRAGMLYGTTQNYGSGDAGAVFELNPQTQSMTTLAAFPTVVGPCPPCTSFHPAGATPVAGLTLQNLSGGAIVLYGTTEAGGGSMTNGCNAGVDSCGTVFALTP